MASAYLAKWQVLRTLRGSYPDESYFSFFATEARQRLPTVGQAYILITNYTSHQITRILENTPENLRRVEEALGGGKVRT